MQYKDDISAVCIGYSNGHCEHDKNEELENCENTVCIDVKTHVNFFEKLLSVGAISDFSYDCDLEDETYEDYNS